MDKVRMPIGRFARLCGLSVKQLRHYDDLGLLRPAWVDPDSSYRYYRANQARDALSIGLLRSLDVPLPAIGQVLAGQGIAEVLGRVRDQMEADLVRRRRMLATLDRVLTDGLPRAEVRLTRVDARRVAATQGAGGIGEIPAVTSDCVARLIAALEEAGLPGPGRSRGTRGTPRPDRTGRDLQAVMSEPWIHRLCAARPGLVVTRGCVHSRCRRP